MGIPKEKSGTNSGCRAIDMQAVSIEPCHGMQLWNVKRRCNFFVFITNESTGIAFIKSSEIGAEFQVVGHLQ